MIDLVQEYYNIYDDLKVVVKDAVDYIQSTPKDYGQSLLNKKGVHGRKRNFMGCKR